MEIAEFLARRQFATLNETSFCMTIIGLDIGGANIKVADLKGNSISRPFPIWQKPDELSRTLKSMFAGYSDVQKVGVTMTAELADCFSAKEEGVRFILRAVEDCFASNASGSVNVASETRMQAPNRLLAWTTNGRFVDFAEACKMPIRVAAANWHALATWCGQFARDEAALLVDIGTTTTDIIPLQNGRPVPVGLTDTTRLVSGELCYSGIRRTPLSAVAHSVPFRDGYCPLAAELFATTLDVYLLLGDIEEQPDDHDTANGKPATRDAAYDRIVRTLCADRTEVSYDEAVGIARFLADVQRQRLAGALERVVARFTTPIEAVILSGSGSFLARRMVHENRRTKQAKIVGIDELHSSEVSEAACAFAVANLLLKEDISASS
jgi:probable H4MPT-linked C1 transfer pathway protein